MVDWIKQGVKSKAEGEKDFSQLSLLYVNVSEMKERKVKHLNAEFQKTERKDKKDFLSEKCKEIEENNRMGKTRSLQENSRYQGKMSYKDELNK